MGKVCHWSIGHNAVLASQREGASPTRVPFPCPSSSRSRPKTRKCCRGSFFTLVRESLARVEERGQRHGYVPAEAIWMPSGRGVPPTSVPTSHPPSHCSLRHLLVSSALSSAIPSPHPRKDPETGKTKSVRLTGVPIGVRHMHFQVLL